MINPNPNFGNNTSTDKSFKSLRSLSYILDSAIPIPGTKYRIGLDPILGLVPAAGDYLAAAFSAYIVIQAAQMGASNGTLFSMVFNIIIDTLVGTVPMLGDLFDFAWKANTKNIALLETHLDSAGTNKKANWGFVVLLLGVLLLVIIGITTVSLFLLKVSIEFITG